MIRAHAVPDVSTNSAADAVHNKYYSAFRFTDREPEGYN